MIKVKICKTIHWSNHYVLCVYRVLLYCILRMKNEQSLQHINNYNHKMLFVERKLNNIHSLWIANNDTFEYLCNGIKTIEGRIFHSSIREMHRNQIIYICKHNRYIPMRIINLHLFDSFHQLLSNDTSMLKSTLPSCSSIESGRQLYSKMYAPKRIKKYGVVAIVLERIVSSYITT